MVILIVKVYIICTLFTSKQRRIDGAIMQTSPIFMVKHRNTLQYNTNRNDVKDEKLKRLQSDNVADEIGSFRTHGSVGMDVDETVFNELMSCLHVLDLCMDNQSSANKTALRLSK
ncbi:hypothetical protein KP509_17G056100 [Ceratopteris richardii]|uniref:Uncharacterized protein n=1 Tax=Ceratopteris richardii TaxID=49495 RepID=A0A8T2SVY9_CERRI|nr:hypothetical protein KP509_17G056100 [Ceratopteris richardii]